jgi:hypothetical protein
VHVLRPGPAGELEDESDADDVDEAQPTEIEHDTFGTAGQRPADRVPDACPRGDVTFAVKLDAGGRSPLSDHDSQI